jgi:hypothetical protein
MSNAEDAASELRRPPRIRRSSRPRTAYTSTQPNDRDRPMHVISSGPDKARRRLHLATFRGHAAFYEAGQIRADRRNRARARVTHPRPSSRRARPNRFGYRYICFPVCPAHELFVDRMWQNRRVAPGISARGSHRSVRKPLGLYGSCHSVHQTLGTEGTQIQCANIRGNRSTIPRQHRSAFPFARSRLYFLRIQRIR